MKNLQVPAQLKKAAINLAKAQAAAETVKPIVHAYQMQALNELEAVNRYTGETITDVKHAWTITEDKEAAYYARIEELKIEAGWTDLPKDHCPLLVAESIVRDAERALLKCSLLLPLGNEQVDFNEILNLDKRKEAVDLMMGFAFSKK
jgi:hypothetical protein